MALADLVEIASVLACPRCRSGLVQAADGFRCSDESCPLHGQGPFPTLDRWPVLVDFEHSILSRTELTDSPHASAGLRRPSIDRLPARLRPLFKPRNAVAARNVETLLSLLPGTSPLVLVIGGGAVGNGVDALYADPRARAVGLDLYRSESTQLIADAHRIPLTEGSVDAVVIQAVLEHVLDPAQVVREIRRVLRAGGLVYAETPFLQQVHAGPYDFTRFTSSGHRYLFRAFEEIAAGPVAGPGTQLLWSIDHAVRALLRSNLAGKLARALFFWLRAIDRLVPLTFAMDNASAYFFLGRRADRELTPAEIVGYYRGAGSR
jgi:ubiquinone/menaquinone biosynthesis C-methylase UbiE